VNVLDDAQFVKYTEKNSNEEEGIAFLKISCWGAQPVQLLAVDGLEARTTVNILVNCIFLGYFSIIDRKLFDPFFWGLMFQGNEELLFDLREETFILPRDGLWILLSNAWFQKLN
jgi:hypothetical protein